MNDCCNMMCDGVSKRIRCGKCRRAKDFHCVSCDIEVSGHFKLYCEDCAIFSRLRYAKEAQKEYRRTHKDIVNANARKNRIKRKELNNSIATV